MATTGATNPANQVYGNSNQQRQTESNAAIHFSIGSFLGKPNNVFLINNAGHNQDANGASVADKTPVKQAAPLGLAATQVIPPLEQNPVKPIAQAAQNPTLLGDANNQTLSPMALQKKKNIGLG